MKQMLEIVDVLGREIIDSRGNPTVEVEVCRPGGRHHGPRRGPLRRFHRYPRSL